MTKPLPEVWLRGPIEGVPPLLQAVAHGLLQCREELSTAVAGLTPAQLWTNPAGAASIGYHVQHAAGSLGRLFTYARGEQLSDAQRKDMLGEQAAGQTADGATLLDLFSTAVDRALDQLRTTNEQTLLDPRGVGRAQLPSTVIGLLFHAAEHTQRHTGQVATTVRMVRHQGDGRPPKAGS
jgi:uncharacterized damage-inducible protein DinB